MEGVYRTFLHSAKRYADAHTVVTGCIVYKGVAVPYATRLFLSEKVYPELGQNTILVRARNSPS